MMKLKTKDKIVSQNKLFSLYCKLIKIITMGLILFLLETCTKNEEPLRTAYITGRVIDRTTNTPITDGQVSLMKDGYTPYKTVKLNNKGEFNFEFTNKECRYCGAVNCELGTLFLSKGVYTCALYDEQLEGTCALLPYIIDNKFDKPNYIEFYVYHTANLEIFFKSIAPYSENDLLNLKINNAVDEPNQSKTLSIKGIQGIDSYSKYSLRVFGNKTCTIDCQIQKGGQTINKSIQVVAESFKTTTITI
jgi:hypothetical protein